MSTITQDINTAISLLGQDNIVAIPTETVYGLAGCAESESAIKKIFALKNRPLTHPLIMHVAKEWDLSRWVSAIPDYAFTLMQAFWPGPLTLVFPCKTSAVSPLITGGQATIAIRCPAHPLALSLLMELNFPLVAPSANPFGKISPTTAQHVQHSFPHQSLLILDGGRCLVGIESTIIDATLPDRYQILRHGVINEHAIAAVVHQGCTTGLNAIRVPGKLESHYQPDKPLYCFTDRQHLQYFCQTNAATYVLSFSHSASFYAHLNYQLPENPDQFAYELYYQLRMADESAATAIAIELPPDEHVWQGVRERLLKAGQVKSW